MRIIFFLPEATAIFLILLASKRYEIRLIDYSNKTTNMVEKDNIAGILKKFKSNLNILILLPVFLLAVLNQVLFVSQTNAFPDSHLYTFTALFSIVMFWWWLLITT